MAYRFCDTGRWITDRWFIDLSAHQKLLFVYFCDNCDIAGFMELSLRKLSFDLQLTPEEVKIAIKGIERSYILSKDKKTLFLKNFIKHQKNLPLNLDNKSHIGILKRFELYNEKFEIDLIDLIYSKNHIKNKPLQRGLSKDKDIDNGILKFEDYTRKIPFKTFWDLYGKKVGDKEAIEKQWNHYKYEIQNEIIEKLPKWKMQFDDLTYLPHPKTFLNQQRWKDEISPIKETKSVNGVTKTIVF
jgi:hypothetical protein